MMKRLFLSIGMAVAFTTVAAAAEPGKDAAPAASTAQPSAERLELARRYIASSELGEMMVEEFRAGYRQTAYGGAEDESQMAAAEKRAQRALARIEPEIRKSMPQLLETYAQLYAREFSEEELQQLIAFTESPLGRRYRERHGLVQADPALVEAQAELWTKLGPTLEDIRKELCAERTEERIAAGDTKAKCPLAAGSETRAS